MAPTTFNRDVQMIKDSNRWPAWPLLPLKKRDDFNFHNNQHFGLMLETPEGHPFVVYVGANIFEGVPSCSHEPQKTYHTAEELANEWRVD